jgi:hypothetical protein
MFISPFNTEISRNQIRNDLAIIICEKKSCFYMKYIRNIFVQKDFWPLTVDQY